MPTTINRTLPNDWHDNITYNEGDLVVYDYIIYRCEQTSIDNRPDQSPEYWKPLDIFIKDSTVMDGLGYSGDENFWNRDNIYIDSAGWVYVNNENTGINVRGPAGSTTVSFDDLTPAQLEQIRGPQGLTGPQGPQGPVGPQGPMGEVELTPSQIEELRGHDGKSTYEIWLENGHFGTQADFLAWVRDGQIFVDDHLDSDSVNPVQNKVITDAYQIFKNNILERLEDLETRVANLENRLKYQYQGEDKYFRFGISTEGKYGYYYNNSQTLIPFDHTNTDNLMSTEALISNGNFLNEFADSGILQEDPSLNTDNIVISTAATAVNINDFFHNRTYLYQNGEFSELLRGFYFYDMYYNYGDPTDVDNLTNTYREVVNPSMGNREYGEGIMFKPSNLNNLSGHIHFIVKALQGMGESAIRIEVGTFTGETVNLPDVIKQAKPAAVTKYQQLTLPFTESSRIQDIEYLINPNEGIYLGDIVPNRFQIMEIYFD